VERAGCNLLLGAADVGNVVLLGVRRGRCLLLTVSGRLYFVVWVGWCQWREVLNLAVLLVVLLLLLLLVVYYLRDCFRLSLVRTEFLPFLRMLEWDFLP